MFADDKSLLSFGKFTYSFFNIVNIDIVEYQPVI